MQIDAHDICIQRGTLREYQQLARFHYRPGRPGGVVCTYVMFRKDQPTVVGRFCRQRCQERQLLGALVVTMPPLSCRLRDVATDGRYRGLQRSLAAQLLNREMRTISRVVIDPRCRGMGLAVRLVRHAIAQNQTPYVEALAAMGRVHPFFERAGMTRFDRPPLPCDARLIDALQCAGLQPTDLVDVQRITRIVSQQNAPETTAAHAALLRRELLRWYRVRSRRRRQHTEDENAMDAIVLCAAQQFLSQPVYFIVRCGT